MATLLLGSVCCLLPPLSAGGHAAEPADVVQSLVVVPEDAVFFTSALRNREQLEAVVSSKTWGEIWSIPALQVAWMFGRMQLESADSPWQSVREFFQEPENQPLQTLLGEMFSDEIFVYGGSDYLALIDVLMEINAANRLAPIIEVLQKQNRRGLEDDEAPDNNGEPCDESLPPADGEDDEVQFYGQVDQGGSAGEEACCDSDAEESLEEALRGLVEDDGEANVNEIQISMILDAVFENLDRLTIPDTVVGFRVESADVAVEQLARLEKLLGMVADNEPDLSDALGRETVNGTEFVTLTLPATLLPWEEFSDDELPLDDDRVDAIIEHFKQLQLVLAVGVWDNFLLVSIGDGTDHLTKLGGAKTLASRQEFHRLRPHMEAKITGAAYISDRMVHAMSTNHDDLDAMVDFAAEIVVATNLDEPLQGRILGDVRELIDDIKQYLPEPKAIVQCSYLTERGIGQHVYNWSVNKHLDGSRRLSLLDHLGGRPLWTTVVRGKYAPDLYPRMQYWLKKAWDYAEEFGVSALEPDDRKEFEEAIEAYQPLLMELDRITRQKLVPAVADGQIAMLFDAQSRSARWLAQYPATGEPLPLPLPAIVVGVDDAGLLEEAMRDYRKLLDQAIEVAAELGEEQSPEELPELIPSPDVKRTPQGKLFVFPLPTEVGVDAQLAPTLAISNKVAVFALTSAHAERLLGSHPLPPEGPLVDTQRPLYGATYFDWFHCVEAARPWVDFAVRMIFFNQDARLQDAEPEVTENFGEVLGDPDLDTPEISRVLEQVHQVLRILQVMRSYSSVTYLEDNVQVTWSEVQLVDFE